MLGMFMVTREQVEKESAAIVEALAKPPTPVLPIDDLRGDPVIGFEGKYWHVREDDKTPSTPVIGPNGSRHYVLHQPTGSAVWYRKREICLNGGKRLPVWEICNQG